MPRFDRSGPTGRGPMTGGRRGRCAGMAMPGWQARYGGGYGQGMGRCRGRGFPPAFGAQADLPADARRSPEGADEMQGLRADAEAMQNGLAAIQKRIAELEEEKAE